MIETIGRVTPSPRVEGARARGGGDGAIVHSPARVHATTWERFTVRSLALVKYVSRDAATGARARRGDGFARIRALGLHDGAVADRRWMWDRRDAREG